MEGVYSNEVPLKRGFTNAHARTHAHTHTHTHTQNKMFKAIALRPPGAISSLYCLDK